MLLYILSNLYGQGSPGTQPGQKSGLKSQLGDIEPVKFSSKGKAFPSNGENSSDSVRSLESFWASASLKSKSLQFSADKNPKFCHDFTGFSCILVGFSKINNLTLILKTIRNCWKQKRDFRAYFEVFLPTSLHSRPNCQVQLVSFYDPSLHD